MCYCHREKITAFLSYGFILLVFLICLTHGITIKTPQGSIKGIIKKSLNGRDIQTFHGIPYAKPPLGNLRFKVS